MSSQETDSWRIDPQNLLQRFEAVAAGESPPPKRPCAAAEALASSPGAAGPERARPSSGAHSSGAQRSSLWQQLERMPSCNAATAASALVDEKAGLEDGSSGAAPTRAPRRSAAATEVAASRAKRPAASPKSQAAAPLEAEEVKKRGRPSSAAKAVKELLAAAPASKRGGRPRGSLGQGRGRGKALASSGMPKTQQRAAEGAQGRGRGITAATRVLLQTPRGRPRGRGNARGRAAGRGKAGGEKTTQRKKLGPQGKGRASTLR